MLESGSLLFKTKCILLQTDADLTDAIIGPTLAP